MLITRSRDIAFKAGSNVMVRKHITFRDKNHGYTTVAGVFVAVYVMTAGQLMTI